MTPKEKALELVEIFKGKIPITAEPSAVQCAIRCVEQLIKVAPFSRYDNMQSNDLTAEDLGLEMFEEFWEDVKEELQSCF